MSNFTGSIMNFIPPLAAALNDGNRSLDCLNRIKQDSRLTCTTMQNEGGNPVMESPLATAQCIHDMLVQSWGDTIRVFPAVPDVWRDVCFRDLRAEGAFLVSAARKEGKTQWLRVKSLAGEPCRIKTDLAEPTLQKTSRLVLKTVAPGVYELNLKKGDEAVLVPKAAKTAAVDVAPVEPAGGVTNCFGLNPHQAQ